MFTCLPYDEAPAMRSTGLYALCFVMAWLLCPLISYALYRAFLYSYPMYSDRLDEDDFGYKCPLCCCLAALLFFWFLTCAFLSAYYGPARNESGRGACDPRVPPWHTRRIALVVCGGIATGIWCCLWKGVGGCESAAPVSAAPSSPPPLYIACQKGQVEAARLLLENGAEVDQADKDGATPLFAACENGHVDAARLLLDKGADVDRATNRGDTPLSIAKRRRQSAVVALLEEPRPLPLGKPRPQRQQSDVQCSICLGPYVERAWTKCNHSFCRECITEVCRRNPPTNRAPCPFCRRPVLLGELARRYTTLGIVVDATPSPPRHTTEQVFEGSDADAAQVPTVEPTSEPTEEPTSEPTAEPTSEPTENA